MRRALAVSSLGKGSEPAGALGLRDRAGDSAVPQWAGDSPEQHPAVQAMP